METIQFAKKNLRPHFPPGRGFHYGDTGYQLLGLMIERVTGRPMHESLHELILDPLGMERTYQLFYSEPRRPDPRPMVEMYLDDVEVSGYRSLSVDWAGGGIVSTTGDLLRFHQALVHDRLITPETMGRMQTWVKMRRGIEYGYGLAKLKFKGFFLLLPRSYDSWGNFGSTATFMFYNPAMDLYMIGTFNQTGFVEGQVRFMIGLLGAVSKALKKL
jgi:CubicO group peptidase (beta-lactamase class C family)